jgi:hypothetical protein
MNEQIKQLWEEAAKTTQSDSWEEQTKFMERFAELILNDVMSICEDLGDKGQDGHYCVDAIRRKYFGVEEQSTKPNELHTCPYAEEIHGDYETLCGCDEERTRQCAMDV